MSLKLKWMADLKAESDLRAMNVPFAVRTIRMSEIDVTESLANCGRLRQAELPEVQEDYAQGMRNGDTFPRPIVWKGAGGFVILSGIQRRGAIVMLIENKEVEKNPAIEVYEVETEDKMLIEAIARAGNVHHGARTTWDDRMEHAVEMVRRYGMRPTDAATLFMVSASSIMGHVRAEEVRKELGQSGVDASMVPNTTLETLSRVRQHGKVFRNLGVLVAQHRPTKSRLAEAVNRVEKMRSDTTRLNAVKAFEKELSEVTRAGNTKSLKAVAPKALLRPRRDKLVRLLGTLAEFLDSGKLGEGFAEFTDLQIVTASDRKQVSDLWQRIEMRMGLILRNRE